VTEIRPEWLTELASNYHDDKHLRATKKKTGERRGKKIKEAPDSRVFTYDEMGRALQGVLVEDQENRGPPRRSDDK
jgi:hypothetical protein